MRSKGNMWIAALCLISLVALASCDTVGVHGWSRHSPGYGPPAHAKAYGCRRHQVYGYDLVYDADCGLYVVVGMTDWYYHDGYFYRWYDGVWQISLRADAWGPAGHDRLPPGLRMKGKPMVAVAGPGNGPVKVNGNGNSLIKLNGNSGGHGIAKGKK